MKSKNSLAVGEILSKGQWFGELTVNGGQGPLHKVRLLVGDFGIRTPSSPKPKLEGLDRIFIEPVTHIVSSPSPIADLSDLADFWDTEDLKKVLGSEPPVLQSRSAYRAAFKGSDFLVFQTFLKILSSLSEVFETVGEFHNFVETDLPLPGSPVFRASLRATKSEIYWSVDRLSWNIDPSRSIFVAKTRENLRGEVLEEVTFTGKDGKPTGLEELDKEIERQEAERRAKSARKTSSKRPKKKPVEDGSTPHAQPE